MRTVITFNACLMTLVLVLIPIGAITQDLEPATPALEPEAAAVEKGAEPAATEAVDAAAEGEGEFVEIVKENGQAPAATTSTKKSETGENLISITLDDVEMVDVVRMFTKISQANILSNPTNLRGRVTVNLTDVEWKPALESILDMHNLALKEKMPGSKVYSIVPKPPGAPEPMVVETFFLKYATVPNVQTVLKPMLMPGGTISPFSSRNALVVRSTAANVGQMKQVIALIDKLRDQVFIEAKFMELNDEAIKDLGISWQVLEGYQVGIGNLNMSLTENRTWKKNQAHSLSQWDRRSNVDGVNERYDIDGVQYEESTTSFEEQPPDSGNWVAVTKITPTRTISDTINRGKDITETMGDSFDKTITDVRTAVLGADDFRLLLSALKQMNGVSVVSNPKIIVANEQPATIHIGTTERPFVSTVTPATQTSAPVVTYNPGDAVDIGVKLVVTPTVNTMSNITVQIEPELTRFLRDAVAPNGQTYPIIATKKIKTIFCLESGKTVAIGGLTETQDREEEKKVPLLGDIPIIGKYLFSHTHKMKSQQETIIFVTVGIALPEEMQKEDGLPEDTELTHKRLVSNEVARERFKSDLEQLRKAAEAKKRRGTSVRSRLLRRRI